MKVGTICKLKVDCLDNKAGTLGVVFYDYGDGFQAVFENGAYDGFSTTNNLGVGDINDTQANTFLEEVGFEESLAGYQFKNVLQVAEDYRNGLFNIAWSEKWKNFDILRKHKFGTEKLAEYLSQNNSKESEYEKCLVYTDIYRPSWLRFKRNIGGDAVRCCMLSAAKDFADFSHFEYADFGKSIEPRWKQADKTLYPKYVVFRKNP